MFRSRRTSDTVSLVMLSIALVISGWMVSGWVAMLFIGNLYHAGFPVPAVSYNTAMGIVAPLVFIGSLIGGTIRGSR